MLRGAKGGEAPETPVILYNASAPQPPGAAAMGGGGVDTTETPRLQVAVGGVCAVRGTAQLALSSFTDYLPH